MAERPSSPGDLVDRHLARAWRSFAPDPGLSERVRARLTGSAAATMGTVGLGLAANARPQGAWASLQASGKLGAVVGAGLLGVGLLSGYLIRDARDTPPPAAPAASSGVGALNQTAASPGAPPAIPAPVSASAPLPPLSAPLASAQAAPARREAPSPPRAKRRTAATEVPPGGELALLRRVERAVRGKRSALALALIGELEERYPRSSLIEERRAMELMALCGAGATEALSRVRRFLEDHPRSAYAGRIRQMCEEPDELLAPKP